jgi:hypothetical protein
MKCRDQIIGKRQGIPFVVLKPIGGLEFLARKLLSKI